MLEGCNCGAGEGRRAAVDARHEPLNASGSSGLPAAAGTTASLLYFAVLSEPPCTLSEGAGFVAISIKSEPDPCDILTTEILGVRLYFVSCDR